MDIQIPQTAVLKHPIFNSVLKMIGNVHGRERFSRILRAPQNSGFASFSNTRDYIVTQCFNSSKSTADQSNNRRNSSGTGSDRPHPAKIISRNYELLWEIPNLSNTLAALYNLLKKTEHWYCGKEQQDA